MKDSFFIIKKLLVISFVMSFAYICAMEDNKKTIEVYRQESLAASQYNSKNVLLSLPGDILYSIFLSTIDTKKPLKDVVKPSLFLTTLCKKTNSIDLIVAIGKRCSCYGGQEKNRLMDNLLKQMNKENYFNMRNSALVLIHAGADNNPGVNCSLLKKAIEQKDISMITILFNNNVNPNQQTPYSNPDFFSIEAVEIAQKFIDHPFFGVNAVGCYNPNVIWKCIVERSSLALIRLYLDCKGCAKIIDISKNECIFHQCARILCDGTRNFEEAKDIAQLLLEAASDVINTVNTCGRTPLDVLKLTVSSDLITRVKYDLCQYFITLFEQYGAKTALQLLLDEQSLKSKQELRSAINGSNDLSGCIICYDDRSENMIQVPCLKGHDDWVCTACYDEYLTYSNNCPKCGTALS